MLQLSILSLALGLLAIVRASPVLASIDVRDNLDPHRRRYGCLTTQEANVLRDRYIKFFVTMDAAEQKVASNSLVDNFLYQSDSINWLTQTTSFVSGTPTDVTKAKFISDSASGDPEPVESSFLVLNSDHGCNSFHFRWRQTSNNPGPFQGIDYVVVQKGSYLLEKAYSEWDVGQFLTNYGLKVVPNSDTCTTTAS